MPTVHLDNISFSYSTRPLLNHITFSVGDGERACIVGPNGCGKSTLLEIIAGKVVPEEGKITVAGTTCSTPSPNMDSIDHSEPVSRFLDLALAPLKDVVKRFDATTARMANDDAGANVTQQYDELLTQMSSKDLWSLDARVDEILSGLSLRELAENGRARPLSTLSPGQRARLELATILIAQPDVLVLDEPTNHLDEDGVDFLTQVLQDRHCPVLFVSHNRAFIERNATVIYDLDIASWQAVATAEGAPFESGVYRCAGGYSNYLEKKNHARNQHEKLHSEQQLTKRTVRKHRQDSQTIAQGGIKLARAEGMAKKFHSDRAASTSVRRTRNDDRRLERLSEHEVRKPRDHAFRLNFSAVKPAAGMAISVRDAELPHRLKSITFDLAYGEHLLITGVNGAGKSTLLTWIAQGHPPTDAGDNFHGHVDRDPKLAFVPQRLPQLGDTHLTEDIWNSGVGELGAGAIHPALWNTPIHKLSAGNQRRVQLALTASVQPSVLIIDEPTNYLDLTTTESLERTLFEWTGTLLVSTHDQWLIDHWPGKHLRLDSAR